jgi:hypothetical protein
MPVAAEVAAATMAAVAVAGLAAGIVQVLVVLGMSMLHTLAVGRRLHHQAADIADMMLSGVRKVSVIHIGVMLVLVDIRVATARWVE